VKYAVPLLFLMLCFAPLCAQETTTKLSSIAIADFKLNGVDSSQGAALIDALAAELKSTGRFRVMERSQMDKILQEQGFQESCVCDNSNCAIQVGQLLSIDEMVIGSLSQVGSTVAINARVVDVGSGEVSVALNRSSSAGFIDLLQNVIPKLASGLADPQGPYGVNYKPVDTQPMAVTQSQEKPLWPWIVGGVAVAGGVILAVILSSSSEGDESTIQQTTETQLHFTW